MFFETFTVQTSSNVAVNLIPNGSNIYVTFDNRNHYCDLVVEVRLVYSTVIVQSL